MRCRNCTAITLADKDDAYNFVRGTQYYLTGRGWRRTTHLRRAIAWLLVKLGRPAPRFRVVQVDTAAGVVTLSRWGRP